MKILQVGLGAFGKNHFRILNELGFEVYAADISDRALEICGTYNIPSSRITNNYKDFLDIVDAVDVVTPADKHFTVVMDALQARKPVFVEKPITYKSDEGEQIARYANRNGLIVQVGHLYRFNPAMQYIQQAIEKNLIGRVRYISGEFFELKRARTDVGVVLTDGIHYIDLANLCFGGYPSEVYAEMQDNFERGMEDLGIVFLKYSNGLAKIETGIIQPVRSREFIVDGTEGIIIADMESQKVELQKVSHKFRDGTYRVEELGAEKPRLINNNPLAEELKDFKRCVERGERPKMDAQTSTNLVKIVELAHSSAKLGRRLEFKPFLLEAE